MLNAPLPRLRVKGAAPARSSALPAPGAVEVERDWIRTGNVWHRSLAVVGYPREVNQGWLAPLLKAAGELDLTLHIGPIPPSLGAARRRRQRARPGSPRGPGA